MTEQEMLKAMQQLLQPTRNDISELKKGQKALESGHKVLEGEVRHTRVLLESTEKLLSIIAESQQTVLEKLDKMTGVETTVEENKDRIGTVETVVKSHSQRINKLEEAVG